MRLLISSAIATFIALSGCVTTRVERANDLAPNTDGKKHPLSEILEPFNKCHLDYFHSLPERKAAEFKMPRPANCTPVHSPDFSLSLSGGGYRAALFHLGAIKRLNDSGLLKHLRMTCVVSGGAITGTWLVDRWNKLSFDSGSVATNFDDEITKPIRSLTDRTIDAPVASLNLLSLGTLGATVSSALDKELFDKQRLVDLPSNEDSPLLVILATELVTTRTWFLSRDYIGDSVLQTAHGQNLLLAQAVTASSAFPVVLGPISFKWKGNAIRQIPVDKPCPSNYSPAACAVGKALVEAKNDEARKVENGIQFIDGGVEDNLGVEKCRNASELNFVSDAGVPLYVAGERAYGNSVDALLRVIDIIHERATYGDYRDLCYASKPHQSVCWRLQDSAFTAKFGLTREQLSWIERSSYLSTRFASVPKETQCALMTQGYLVAANSLIRQGYEAGGREMSNLPCSELWNSNLSGRK